MAVRNCAEMGENLVRIMKKLISNQNLMKLLYYTDNDPLSHEDWRTTEEKEALFNIAFNKLVKIIPIVKEVNDYSVITITVPTGQLNSNNDEFRDIEINIEVFVPLSTWFINDTNLRLFAILGEIQKTLQNKTVNGLGKITGGDFELEFLTETLAAYKMSFSIITYD